MSTDEQNIAISYYIEEIEKQHENDFNIDELMAERNITEEIPAIKISVGSLNNQ